MPYKNLAMVTVHAPGPDYIDIGADSLFLNAPGGSCFTEGPHTDCLDNVRLNATGTVTGSYLSGFKQDNFLALRSRRDLPPVIPGRLGTLSTPSMARRPVPPGNNCADPRIYR